MLQEVTDADFTREVLESDKPVLVDFYGPWCGPCKTLEPSLKDLQSDSSWLKVVKLNIDDNPKTPIRFNVRSVPTMLFFREGVVEGQRVGARTKSDLYQWVQSLSGGAA